MTPRTISAARKASKRERFLPSNAKGAPSFPPELDLEPDDAKAGALQPVNAPDFEGFGSEDEEEAKEEEEDDDESSSEDDDEDEEEDEEDEDEKEPEIVIEKKKKEKVVLPKDAEEEELERIVFGDTAGFKQGIDGFSLDPSAGTFAHDSPDEREDDVDYEDAADQDLFFFDAGPTAAPMTSGAVVAGEDSEDEEDKPAWEDSDDERLVVSLATVPQLRKLRETAEDDIVSGKEYVRRLRKQYERLYSTPDWVVQAGGKPKRKRQQAVADGESDAESASDMDVDDEDLSTQPLANLLKSADILSKASRGSSKRRKLQSGTVDIQRLKDVAGSGPVRVSLPKSPVLLTQFAVCNYLSLVPSQVSVATLLRS